MANQTGLQTPALEGVQRHTAVEGSSPKLAILKLHSNLKCGRSEKWGKLEKVKERVLLQEEEEEQEEKLIGGVVEAPRRANSRHFVFGESDFSAQFWQRSCHPARRPTR